MSDLDFDKLITTMVNAARQELSDRWPSVKDYAEAELEKLARTLVQIGKLAATGQISEGEARVLLEMQKNTTRAVMLAVKGMALLAVEAAINAALEAVKDVVNRAVGFELI